MKKNILIIFFIILFILILSGIIYFINNSNKMIVISGNEKIKVYNIYKKPLETYSNSDVEFKKTPDYTFDFYAKGPTFIITILNKNINAARETAEKDFLNTMQINKEQACKINVQLSVPFNVDENVAGPDYGLSFCPDGKKFPN